MLAISIGPGTSSTLAYVLCPSTSGSFGLIASTVNPWRSKARRARLPNLRLLLDAPTMATVFGIAIDCTRYRRTAFAGEHEIRSALGRGVYGLRSLRADGLTRRSED